MKFCRVSFSETITFFCEMQVHIALWCWAGWVNSILFFFLQITPLALFLDITKFRNMFWSKSSSSRVSGVLFEGTKQYRVYSRCSAPKCNVNLHFTKERNCFQEWHSAEFHIENISNFLFLGIYFTISCIISIYIFLRNDELRHRACRP